MPLYREENFLVVHVGAQHALFAFGLQDSLSPPDYKIPSVVYRDAATGNFAASRLDGYEAVYPVQAGKIAHLEALQYLLKVVLQSVIANNPAITISQIPLLLITPSLVWSKVQIENITKYVFEVLEFTAFNILDLSNAANFGMGNGTSSCVINIGHETTQVSVVVGYQNIRYLGKTLNIGGASINKALREVLPSFSAEQIEALKTSAIYEVVNDHNQTFYSLADLNQNSDEDDDDANFDVARIVTENGVKEHNPDDKPNNQLEKNYFTASNSNDKIWVGKERFQGTKELVNAVAKAIYEAVSGIPELEKKQECFDNLVFTGSTSRIHGFKHAVLIKLSEDYLVRSVQEQPANSSSNGLNSAILAYQQAAEDTNDSSETEYVVAQTPRSIKLAKHPDYFPEWKNPKERGGSWQDVYFLGGQIYAKQVFGGNSNVNGELFVDTETYYERGPQSIWNAKI